MGSDLNACSYTDDAYSDLYAGCDIRPDEMDIHGTISLHQRVSYMIAWNDLATTHDHGMKQ